MGSDYNASQQTQGVALRSIMYKNTLHPGFSESIILSHEHLSTQAQASPAYL